MVTILFFSACHLFWLFICLGAITRGQWICLFLGLGNVVQYVSTAVWCQGQLYCTGEACYRHLKVRTKQLVPVLCSGTMYWRHTTTDTILAKFKNWRRYSMQADHPTAPLFVHVEGKQLVTNHIC
jgi:hypothetical protein